MIPKRLKNKAVDAIGFLPNDDGDVLCIHCQREDNIRRRGANELVGTGPVPGVMLYIHKSELDTYTVNDFYILYYRALAAATSGETAH